MITKNQKAILLEEIANLIVNNKNEVIVTMNKSGISTVTNETPNKILADRIIDELAKNRPFRKNFASLITDVNLNSVMQNADEAKSPEQKKKQADTSKRFGQKIGASLWEMADEFSEKGTAVKKAAKDTVKDFAEKAEEKVQDDNKNEADLKKVKSISKISTTTLIISAVILTGIIYWAKKTW